MTDGHEEVSEVDRAVLDLESRVWAFQGAKEGAIRAELDLSPVAYYQRLNALLDDPAAMAHAPMLINRLRRVRSARRTRGEVAST